MLSVKKSKANQLRELEAECHACRECLIGGQRLDGCLSNVFSNMCIKAQVMVVGQNPGEIEVKLGRPFVGKSGAFFDEVLAGVLDIDRSVLYIANTVRCYTPGNRAPIASEVKSCRVFLDREISILQPELIVTLGNPALKQVTGLSGIIKHHGTLVISPRYGIQVLPLYHPSPLNMNKPQMKHAFRQDIGILAKFV